MMEAKGLVGVKTVFSFATLWGNVRKIHWNHSCWKVKHFKSKVTYRRDVNAGKCHGTHAHFLEGNQKATSWAPPSTILIKDKRCLVCSTRRLPSSLFERDILPRTGVHLHWDVGVVSRAILVRAGGFAWEDKPLSFHLAFPSNYPFSISWWGLVKTAETSELLRSLRLQGRKRRRGRRGCVSAVENNEGGRVLRWGCCAARGEARTACPPTPLWGIAARVALSQHPPARATQPALGRLTPVMAISFAK